MASASAWEGTSGMLEMGGTVPGVAGRARFKADVVTSETCGFASTWDRNGMAHRAAAGATTT